jgi:phosphoglucomutase
VTRADVSPLAGALPDPSPLVDVGRLLDAYDDERPEPSLPEQRVAFGTSGLDGRMRRAAARRSAG